MVGKRMTGKRKTEKSTEEKRIAEQTVYKKESKKHSLCPVSARCGGCQYIDMPYQEQLKLKQKKCKELLKEFGTLEQIIGMENPYHYRNKVHAVYDFQKGKGLVSGIYQEGSHKVIPVDECLIEEKQADQIIATIRELAKSFKIKAYDEDTGYGLLRHVLIRTARRTGQIMLVLVLSSPVLPSKNHFITELCNRHPEITTIVLNVNNKRTSVVLGEKERVIYGKGYIEDILCDKTFRISPKSFYQVNPVQTEKLYQKAIEYAELSGKETIVDAYCGIGTIGLAAADHVRKVIGVELNPDAVRDAVINAKINQIKNVQFYQNDAGRFMIQLAQANEQIDVVFMDPPRSGSTKEFMDAVLTLAPKKIVYISCNTETLVRDLKYFTEAEYAVKRMVAVDMFAFTSHVECVVLMTKVQN